MPPSSTSLDKARGPWYFEFREGHEMTIHLPEDLEQFLRDQVGSGRYASETDVIREALERLRDQVPPIGGGRGSLGAMQDAAEELDEVVEQAMRLRRQSWGAPPRE
jgi:Arc/MetJ-type ribon-helix-helix transcriptional regulator